MIRPVNLEKSRQSPCLDHLRGLSTRFCKQGGLARQTRNLQQELDASTLPTAKVSHWQSFSVQSILNSDIDFVIRRRIATPELSQTR